ALEKLVQYHLLERHDAEALRDAYLFLRDIEHRLQMEQNRQTHTLPVAPVARERMARLMGFGDFKSFEKARVAHTGRVRGVYERLLKPAGPETKASMPCDLEDEEQCHAVLAQHAFRDSAKATRLLREFAHGPGFGH